MNVSLGKVPQLINSLGNVSHMCFCENDAMLLVLRFLFYGLWKSTDKTNGQCHIVILIALGGQVNAKRKLR